MPFNSPTAASRPITRNALAEPRSFIASARTVTVMVWLPALPPIEATIGISTASATICSMVASNRPITEAASSAVNRLKRSQVKRCRAVRHTESATDSPATPPIFRISSEASSCTTSTTSSAVITPTSRLS